MSLITRNKETFPTVPSLFDDYFSRALFNWSNNNFSSSTTTMPAVNIKETTDNFEVQMAAPGMQKEDFQISLDGNILVIASAKRREEEKKEAGYALREFSYCSFQRSFTLPKDVVNENGIEARYENGLLLLTIPKKEEARQKGPRRIEIA